MKLHLLRSRIPIGLKQFIIGNILLGLFGQERYKLCIATWNPQTLLLYYRSTLPDPKLLLCDTTMTWLNELDLTGAYPIY